jgi:hypothetical protein
MNKSDFKKLLKKSGNFFFNKIFTTDNKRKIEKNL